MRKPVLLYYVCPSNRLGSIVRALTIANRLVDRFHVVILMSGQSRPAITVSPEIDVVKLRSLSLDIESSKISVGDSPSLQNDIALRREQILENYSRLKPRVLVIDTFPFGHGKLADELLPVLETIESGSARQPLVVCSLSKLLSGDQHARDSHDNRTMELLNKYFDAVLVHTDPTFAQFGEFFQPRNATKKPVYHTGFVLRERPQSPAADDRARRVVVSAGGGRAGGPLYRAAVEAHRLLWDADRLPMTIVAGPFLPQDELRDLDEAGRDLRGFTLKRSVPDLRAELARSSWAVCHCGYNTALEIIAAKVPALLVPAGTGHESEQFARAQRMSQWGIARVLMPHHLNGASFASGVHQLVKFEPAETSFDLDGAEITANLIYHLFLSEDIEPVLPGPRRHAESKRLH